MKIALLTYSTKPRGSVIHTLELATALTELGHHVSVFALDKDGSGFDQEFPFEVQLVPANPAPESVDALIQQRIQEFVEFLAERTQTFDIYHAQDCIGANALLELRQQGMIPHFARTIHHVEDFQSPYLKQCQDKSIRQPDLRLCVSDGWQQVIKADYGVEAARVVNGVNLDRFSATPDGREAALKSCYGLSESPIFLTVGGIEPRKNSLGLLRAFAMVLKTFPQAQLVIAGGATLFDYQPYREQFFATAQSLGIQIGPSLVLPGVIPAEDLPVLYRCADAFCFPSAKEGWGLVVLEAIASGLPVILSHQPPFTEFLASNQALWVDPETPESIAAAMVRAIQTDTTSLVNSSRLILEQYSWQRSAQIHEHHYQNLLSTHPTKHQPHPFSLLPPTPSHSR
jgi:glycosyltransferase-like protein